MEDGIPGLGGITGSLDGIESKSSSAFTSAP
jgi:hypothetical protein